MDKKRIWEGNMTNEFIKGKIDTPLGKTILVTIVIIVLLIVLVNIESKILIAGKIDASIIFLALLPFLIYLVISGKISEIGAGGFAIKFYKASESSVIFEEEVPYFNEEAVVKWDLDYLKSEILPEFAENPRSTLKVKKEYKGLYKYDASKRYLEELTKFDFFKYVLFVDEDDVFNGYINARSLLALLMPSRQGEMIIADINDWNLDRIPGFKKEYVKNYQSSKEVLRKMKEKRITDVAVVDNDMIFKGFTNREMIIARIVNNLIIKAE